MTWYDQPFNQVQRNKRAARARRAALADLVGGAFRYVGAESCLYRDRVGQRCIVETVSAEKGGCPVVLLFEDGFRGISERTWLEPLEKVGAA